MNTNEFRMLKKVAVGLWFSLMLSLTSCLMDTTKIESEEIQIRYRLEISRDSVSELDSVHYWVKQGKENKTIYEGACGTDSLQIEGEKWVCSFQFLAVRAADIQVDYKGYWNETLAFEGGASFSADPTNPGLESGISWEEIEVSSSSEEEILSSSEEIEAKSSATSSKRQSSSQPKSSSLVEMTSSVSEISSSIPSIASSDNLLLSSSSLSKPSSSSHILLSSSVHLPSSSTPALIPVQLQIQSSGSGSTTGGGAYFIGEWVDINATAGVDYHFYCWAGKDAALVENLSSASTRIHVTMNAEITAVFRKKWTVKVEKLGSGTVLPAAGEYSVWDGENFSLTSTATVGYILDSIRGSQKSDASQLSWKVTKNDSVHVTFGKVEWSLANSTATAQIAWDMAFRENGASNVGYVVAGYQGNPQVWKSTDKGQNWTSLALPSNPESVNMQSVTIEKSTGTVYLGGGLKSDGHCAAYIWKSTNNGSSWTSVGTSGIPADNCVNQMEFLSSSEGYVGTATGLYHTQDGGATWSQAFSESASTLTLDDNGGVYYIGSKWEYSKTVWRARYLPPNGITWVEEVIPNTIDAPVNFFYSNCLDRMIVSGGMDTLAFIATNGTSLNSGWSEAKNGYWESYYMQQNPVGSEVLMAGFSYSGQSIRIANFALDKKTVTGWRTSFMPVQSVLPKGFAEFADGSMVLLASSSKLYTRAPNP